MTMFAVSLLAAIIGIVGFLPSFLEDAWNRGYWQAKDEEAKEEDR